MLTDVSWTASQLVLRVPSRFTISAEGGGGDNSQVDGVYSEPRWSAIDGDYYSPAGWRRGWGNGYLLVWSSPRRSAAFGIDGLELRWADRQTGRLGTPRLQACLDRSSPVSGCCGLVLGVEDSPTRRGGVVQRRCAADCGHNTLETYAAFRLSAPLSDFFNCLERLKLQHHHPSECDLHNAFIFNSQG